MDQENMDQENMDQENMGQGERVSGKHGTRGIWILNTGHGNIYQENLMGHGNMDPENMNQKNT